MKFKNRISLYRALMFPMIAILLILFTVFTTLWQFDYRWITTEHSQKLLTALNENIETKLVRYLNEPLRVNQMIAATISLRKDYLNLDASNIQELLKNQPKPIRQSFLRSASMDMETKIRTSSGFASMMMGPNPLC